MDLAGTKPQLLLSIKKGEKGNTPSVILYLEHLSPVQSKNVIFGPREKKRKRRRRDAFPTTSTDTSEKPPYTQLMWIREGEDSERREERNRRRERESKGERYRDELKFKQHRSALNKNSKSTNLTKR